MKKLIIHADDLGMCHSVNSAIFKAFYRQDITSASIMAPCPWFPQAIEWVNSHPQCDLGVHLTFTSEWKNYKWRPMTDVDIIPDMYAADGYMYDSVEDLLSNSDEYAIEVEACTQIEHILDSLAPGIKLSHMDVHMFAGIDQFYNTYARIADKYNLKFKKLPIFIVGQPSESEWVNHYCDILSAVPEGISQLIVHPGYLDEELKAITDGITQGNAESRKRDVKVLQDWDFKLHLAQAGIELATWKDV